MPSYHLRVAFRSHIAGSDFFGTDVVNTFHVELDALSAVGSWANIANEIYTGLGTEYKNLLGVSLQWDDIVVQTEPTADPGTQVGEHPVAAFGTRTLADSTLGPALGILVATKTATPKRYARGRMWLPPGLNASCLTIDNQWNTSNAYWTTALAFLAKLQSGWTVGDNSYQWEVYSKRQEAIGATPVSFPITANTPRREPHFLRSRTTSP